MPTDAVLGPVAALLSSMTWVVGSSVYAHLSRRTAPAVINLNRALLALPFFVIATLFTWQETLTALNALGSHVPERILWLILSVFASYGFGDILFFWGAVSIGFPSAQAIGALYPLWAALGGLIFLSEPLPPMRLGGMALSILGTIIVVLSGRGQERAAVPVHLPFLKSYALGVLCALGASVCWAFNGFATHRGGMGMPPMASNVLRMGAAAVVCLVLALLQTRKAPRLTLEQGDYKKFFIVFVIESFGGAFFYLYGLSRSPIAVGATLSALAPVFAVPLALALNWEKFSLAKTVGICIVIAGVILLVQ